MRSQCHLCNEWSRELVEVKSEIGPSYPYLVHEHEVQEMKRLVKEARAQIRAEKAQAIATYGQRYHH